MTTTLCPVCGGGPLVSSPYTQTFRRAGATFRWQFPAWLCATCGEWQMPIVPTGLPDALAVRALGALGPLGPEAVRLALSCLGLDMQDAADLLDVTVDEVIGWCDGKLAVPRVHDVVLLELVNDAITGSTVTRDRLQGAVASRPLPSVIDLGTFATRSHGRE